MTERTFLITMGECPKSVNAHGGGVGSSYVIANTEKRRWEGKFLTELMIAKVPREMDRASVDVTIRWRRRNHRDLENYRHPVIKPLADALIKGGYLSDDTEDYFTVESFDFEYPPRWPTTDPRSKVQLVIRLVANYSQKLTKPTVPGMTAK